MGRRLGSILCGALLPLAVALLAFPAGARAGTQAFRVVIVPGLELSDLASLEQRGAVGLLVPGAGPRVSEESALAALERGKVRNSLRGGLPSGPILIDVETAPSALGAGQAIVLGLPAGGDQANDRRYPIAVLGPGYEGLLSSGSTRIPGIVSIADVAPTALAENGALTSVSADDAAQTLSDLDERIRDNGRSRPLAALVAGLVILALAAVLPRAALLAFATVLAANLVLGAAGVSSPGVVIAVVGLSAAVGAPLLAVVVRSPAAVAGVLALVLVGYLVALGVAGEAVALSPFGPTQNSRFYGLSNLLSALLVVPALAATALFQLTFGWLAAGAVAAVALVAVAGSRFGADGGTAIVLVVAYGALAVELAEARRRLAAELAALAAAAVGALVTLDAATGASSHLTDAVGSGPAGLAADLRDRIVLAYERASEDWYIAVLVLAGALVLGLLAARLVLLGVPRRTRALPLAMAIATGVSLVVNDSPLDVVSVGLVGYLALQTYALAELEQGTAVSGSAGYRSAET